MASVHIRFLKVEHKLDTGLPGAGWIEQSRVPFGWYHKSLSVMTLNRAASDPAGHAQGGR
jgi:hypothetical protein